jgi:hypothetical protein
MSPPESAVREAHHVLVHAVPLVFDHVIDDVRHLIDKRLTLVDQVLLAVDLVLRGVLQIFCSCPKIGDELI